MPISRRNFLAGVTAAAVAPMVPAATVIESSGIVFQEVFHPTLTVRPDPSGLKVVKKDGSLEDFDSKKVNFNWIHDLDISSMYATPIQPLVFP